LKKVKKLHLIFSKISQIKENATPIGQEQYYGKNIVVHRSSHSKDGSFNICTFQLLEATWILAGDFNFVESLSDKLGGAPTLGIKRQEQEAWDRLILKLQAQNSFTLDEFKKINKRKYTWDNRHDAPNMIASRIDHIYINQDLTSLGHKGGIWLTLPNLSTMRHLSIYANPN
jgi:exonuclease III